MIRFFLFLPLLLVTIYAVYALFKYTRLISRIFLSLVYRPANEPMPGAVKGERITILDSADHEIQAVLVGHYDAKQIAVFCHESGSGKESWEKYAYFLPELGWSVVSFDLQAPSAENEPAPLSQWPSEDQVAKLLTVIRWTKKAFRPDAVLVLFGISNGADLALAAAAEEPTVRAVIADGLFSMKEIFRDYIRKWAPILVKPDFFRGNYPQSVLDIFSGLSFWYSGRKSGKRFVDVERLLKARHVPLFLIYGAEDDYVPASHQRFLAELEGKGRVRQLVIPKAKHNQAVLVARESYEKDIIEFLKKYVRSKADHD